MGRRFGVRSHFYDRWLIKLRDKLNARYPQMRHYFSPLPPINDPLANDPAYMNTGIQVIPEVIEDPDSKETA